MKKLSPLWSVLCALALMAVAAAFLNAAVIRRPDADPSVLRTGAVFSYLRDGGRFRLSDAYPQEWDTAQFVPSSEGLSRLEQRELFSYDARFAGLEADGPLLLLWLGDSLTSVVAFPADRNGYPRFLDAVGGESFELPRADADFLCTFVPDKSGRGGYYECRAAGERARGSGEQFRDNPAEEDGKLPLGFAFWADQNAVGL